ncbi:hypothetical protein [Okeania sp. SIO3I5]|uniref:hypothetical protein n=1 Tax=Okeania sp. SIO3I5 TaxID=2607805 RepID=UPI0025F32614|nr:hypothetical protein [Okeania sp. SIO3I5]
MAEITTDQLAESLQTLLIEVERTKTPLTVIHEGKALVVIHPAIAETKPTTVNRLASLGQDKGKIIIAEDLNEPLMTEKLNSVYTQNSSDLDENMATMQFSSLRTEQW